MQMDGEEEDKCDELNVQSEKFDALQALYSKKAVVPFPSAPVLDNVAKATSLLSRNQDLVNKPVAGGRRKKEVAPSTSSVKAAGVEPKSGPKGKPQRNVFTRMAEMKGPLAFLRVCMEKRIRVKVWTRSGRGIRGYCLGLVAAFDKHWNLVLEDVLEVWSRRAKRKSFLMGAAREMPVGWRAMGPAVRPPEVVVRGAAGGSESCERRVGQMLLRGEQVAFVSVPTT